MRKAVDSSLLLARDCSRSIDHVDRNHEVRAVRRSMGFRYLAAYSLLFASLSVKYELSDQSFFTWLAVLDGLGQSS